MGGAAAQRVVHDDLDPAVADLSTAAGDIEALRTDPGSRRAGTPEELLLWAMLAQAYSDVALRPRTLGPLRALLDVRAWLLDGAATDPWPFTFRAVCDRLGISESATRAALLGRIQVPSAAIVARARRHGVPGIPVEWEAEGADDGGASHLREVPAIRYARARPAMVGRI